MEVEFESRREWDENNQILELMAEMLDTKVST